MRFKKMEELIRYVSELDIDETAKQTVLEAVRQGQQLKGIRLLEKCRGEILDGLHNEQEKLYQIDFVIQKIKKEELRI